MTARELEAHRQVLQRSVNDLGRDDIAVGEVVEADGGVKFTLTRGDLAMQAELPVDALADPERAKSELMRIIPQLSKAIERSHLEDAQKAG